MTAPASLEAIVSSPAPGVSLVTLSGTIGAGFPRDKLDHLQGAVVLDLDGVTRVTSYGVPEWIAALESIDASFLGLIRCRPAIVAQLNMVAGFVGRGEVLSLYLPYICEHCDHEQQVLMSAKEAVLALRRGGPRPLPCPRCKEPAELDDIASSYLSFVSSAPEPSPPRAVSRLLGLLEGATPSSSFQLRKEVEGDVTALWIGGHIDRRLRTKRLLDGLEGHVVVICAGVTGMDELGAERLRELAERTNAYFARVSLALLQSLPPAGVRAFRGRVLSALLTPPHRKTLEFDARILAQEIARVDGGGRAAEWLTADMLATLKDLLAGESPIELADYLRDRPGGEPTPVEPKDTASARAPGRIGERYRIVRRIGRGGMAEVLLAEVLGPGGFKKRVVVKRVLPELTRDPELSEMFLREARLSARISHPNVVQIHDLGQEGADYFIAMEYVRGWDLRSVLRYARRLKRSFPIELCCRVVSDVAAGLHAAHSARGEDGRRLEIIHRDVSPDNVLISVQGGVKVTDFGISKPAGANLGTRPGTVRGKVIYISPEQLDGTLGAVDRRVDVFAAGLVLHECLTGVPALWRNEELASMRAALEADIPPIEEKRPDVPPSLVDVIRRATARLPTDRFETARHLHLALERVLLDIGQPASSAHLAHWLHGLARQGYAEGEIRRLDFTPPHGALLPNDEEERGFDRTQTEVDAWPEVTMSIPDEEVP